MGVVIEEITATVLPPDLIGERAPSGGQEQTSGGAPDPARLRDALERMRERECRVRAD